MSQSWRTIGVDHGCRLKSGVIVAERKAVSRAVTLYLHHHPILVIGSTVLDL
jgi:hypothetical protein